MTNSAALLADEVLPAKPIRQWVLSLPFALRFFRYTYLYNVPTTDQLTLKSIGAAS